MRIALWMVFAVLWAGGVITGGRAPGALWTAPVFLILAGVLAYRKELIPAVLIGFAAEIIGIHTGFPFGTYTYTGALGPQIAGAPIAIAAAWLVIADLATSCRRPWSLLIFIAADLAIDPLGAGPLRYWKWAHPGHYYGVPVTNYLGWILTASLITAAVPSQAKTKPAAGLSVMAFFTIQAARYNLWLPAAAGLILTLSVAGLWYQRWETSYRTIPKSE